jgi:hypothetical protein
VKQGLLPRSLLAFKHLRPAHLCQLLLAPLQLLPRRRQRRLAARQLCPARRAVAGRGPQLREARGLVSKRLEEEGLGVGRVRGPRTMQMRVQWVKMP